MSGEGDVVIGSYEGINEFDRLSFGSVDRDDSRISIHQIQDAEMHRKTYGIAPHAIRQLDFSPSHSSGLGERTISPLSGPSKAGRVAGFEGPAPAEIRAPNAEEESDNFAWKEVRNDAEEEWPVIDNGLAGAEPTEPEFILSFPDATREGLEAGFAKERANRVQLQGYIKQAKEYQKNIDLFIQLTTELTAAKPDQDFVLPESAKSIMAELKARGIEVWKGDPNKIPKDKIHAVKSDITGQSDQNRNKLNTLFTADIQPLIGTDASLIQALQGLLRDRKDLMRTIMGNIGKQ